MNDDSKIVQQLWWARLAMMIEGDARDFFDSVDEIAEKLWKAGATDERPAVISGQARHVVMGEALGDEGEGSNAG